ncbi:MAG: PKD domain-containing protein [Chitinophagaceae bacterium]
MNTLKRLITSITAIAFSLALFAQDYNNIEFIENKGQWDARVKFKGDVNAGAVFVRSSGFTILQHNLQDYAAMQDIFHGHNKNARAALTRPDGSIVIRSHAYNVDFVGASPKMQVVADKPIPTVNNYFTGDDPSKWGEGCHIYQAITLKDVYPNVDVRYYTDNGTLKYDIIARPGADIGKIALKYDGVDRLQVKNKELVVSTSVGELRESSPYTYQANGKQRLEVGARYVVKDNIVRFDIKDYDRSSTLVIDPSLIFCSFTNSTANNWGFTATYGPDGSFFGGGIVFNGNSFPVSTGAFQTVFQGGAGDLGCDIGIIKLSPNGSTRIYATYLGGTGNEQPHSLVVDPQGNLVIAGRTNSPLSGAGSYPLRGGGLIGIGGGYDIVVTKLNATGSGLIGSVRIGGNGNDGVNIREGRDGRMSLEQNYGDDGRSEVILDGTGNIYVASCSQSRSTSASEKFPVSPGAFQQDFAGGEQDGVLMKFDGNLSARLFASYLGGTGNDAAYVLALGPSGDIYVAGGTERGILPTSSNTDFVGSHAGTVGPSSSGGIDGFVAQVSNDGSTIIRSAYIGTGGTDQVFGIQLDRNGFPYIMGQTTGTMAPINATYSNANSKQFIAKLQPDLSAYVYRTVFGNGSTIPNISPTAFLVDRCENVYVSGWGGSNAPGSPYPSAGTMGMPVTPDRLPYPPGGPDGMDFYFFVLKKDAASQLFGSYFGQNGGYEDHVDGGTSRFDVNGVIYQAICANCGGGAAFPTTPGVWGPVRPASANCNMAMVKIAFNLAGVGSDVQASINGVANDTAGCVPLTVDFTDIIGNATEYEWDFGDGSPRVGPAPAADVMNVSHTYMAVGTYEVMLIAIDPASCNGRDTSYVTIRVGNRRAALAADVDKLEPCEQLNYVFHNLTPDPDPANPFTDTTFAWNFGDGSPRVIAGTEDVTHTYPSPGTYDAWLILRDTGYCNYPDSIKITINVAVNLDASFETSPTGCAPYTAVFTYTGAGGETFAWDFGDPASGADNTSSLMNPTHLYANAGTYLVVLNVTDPNTCNVTDVATLRIVVEEKPDAQFSYTPNPPIVNTQNTFTNLSSANATRFKWIFGDGDILETASRADVTHQYNATGRFEVLLVAFNNTGCTDTARAFVDVIIEPALDVPNAFTPNSGNINSVVMPRGFGIAKMRFIIWNRWGQKVFETANRNEGWNGRVNGVVQPMDVYAYTLDVEFFDGTKATKKGDITLIR